MARQNRANNFGDGPAVARLGAKNECLFSAGRFGATHVPQMCPIKVNGERRIPTEWDVVIGNSHDFRGGDVRVDVSPLLGRERRRLMIDAVISLPRPRAIGCSRRSR